MNKPLQRKANKNFKTLQAYCTCSCTNCYCVTSSKSQGNYVTTSTSKHSTELSK